MRSFIGLFIILNSLLSCKKAGQDERFPLAHLYNIDEQELSGAFDEMKKVEGALSMIVFRHDTIIAEEFFYYNSYGPDSIKNIMSVTKSFTGILVGLAVDKGLIESVNDPVGKYLSGIVSFPDETKESVTIDQLLKMASGHSWNGTSPGSKYSEWITSPDQLQYIIDLPHVSTPGTLFNYSDGASHLLSVIISVSSGLNTQEFARENLLDPLGIKEFEWQTDNRGYPIGAAGLRITPRDMVKFGILILNKGKFRGRQIVSENWIEEMTSVKIITNNDVLYGPEYGYQIWLGSYRGYKYYMAMGWGGQFIFILPDYETVITATCWTSGLTWQQAGEHWTKIIRIIVERILPALN